MTAGDRAASTASSPAAVSTPRAATTPAVAREPRGLSLGDALDFTALVALRDRPRSRRMTARWLQRWLDETASVTIDEAAMVAGCLAALGGPAYGKALAACAARGMIAPETEKMATSPDLRTCTSTCKKKERKVTLGPWGL